MIKAKSGATKRLRLTVKGTVQGVGYRWFVRRTADSLGITGWVRNLPEGSVEIEAEQSPEVLRLFQEKLRSGHPWARVSDIAAEPLPSSSNLTAQFHIIE